MTKMLQRSLIYQNFASIIELNFTIFFGLVEYPAKISSIGFITSK